MTFTKTALVSVAFTCLLGAVALPGYAADAQPQKGDKASMQAAQDKTSKLVKDAVAYLGAHSQDDAFKEFDKSSGDFTKGSDYIFVVDYQGKFLASGGNPKMVGQVHYDLKDIKGRYIIRDLIKAAKAGGGWTSYYWNNPASNKVECKKSYAESYNKQFLVGSGFYYLPDSKGKC